MGESGLLRAYKKGIRVGEDRTTYFFRVLKKESLPNPLEDLKISGKMRKELIYAFVGERIQFVKASRINFD
jgi:tRNA splicing endonuclease